MKIKEFSGWSFGDSHPEYIPNWVRRKLDGSGYGVGQIEAVKDTTKLIAESYGRLIEVLVNSGKLSTKDLQFIINDSTYYELELVEEDSE